jgi:predicted secreted protein
MLPDARHCRAVQVVFSLRQNAPADSDDAARRQAVAVTAGETFTVALQHGPASGYKWKVEGVASMDMGDPFASIRTGNAKFQNKNKFAADTAIQELQDEYTTEPAANRHVKLGQTSHQLFRFKATAPGNSILRFAYRRPFDDAGAEPADSVVVEVRASSAEQVEEDGRGEGGGPAERKAGSLGDRQDL